MTEYYKFCSDCCPKWQSPLSHRSYSLLHRHRPDLQCQLVEARMSIQRRFLFRSTWHGCQWRRWDLLQNKKGWSWTQTWTLCRRSCNRLVHQQSRYPNCSLYTSELYKVKSRSGLSSLTLVSLMDLATQYNLKQMFR
jgi:hypothetical protein